MRIQRAEDLLRLILWLQTSHVGIGLRDIEEEFAVSRRTAERMRDAVARLCSGLTETTGDDGRKRWRLPRTLALQPRPVSADELASLDVARRLLERDSLDDHVRRLTDLERKIRVLEHRGQVAGREVDLEALIEAEGLAMSSGPRPQIDHTVLEVLRLAVLACDTVLLRYKARGTGKISRQRVCPYGFLYGRQHYLVAWNSSPASRDYRFYALGNILRAHPLGEPFIRRENFSLRDFAERSFGVFQGRKHDVELVFSARAGEDARRYRFHPRQTIEPLEDGRVRVTMHVAGLRELAWHLITWGQEVEVRAPERLKEMVTTVQQAMASSRAWLDGDD